MCGEFLGEERIYVVEEVFFVGFIHVRVFDARSHRGMTPGAP